MRGTLTLPNVLFKNIIYFFFEFQFVPLIVELCTQIVEAKGLEMTGVYRIPGNKAGVTLLQEEFNKGIEAMNRDLDKWSDVNVISSLLKSFFRELPEPLIPDGKNLTWLIVTPITLNKILDIYRLKRFAAVTQLNGCFQQRQKYYRKRRKHFF